ncbi:MAG: 16S rRNA (cytosine1402-N4)-methyltransferase [Gammaproteobacteria bacterium]
MHDSVLLRETIELLCIRADGIYVDCTFGRGGHTREVLHALDHRGRVLAIDRDLDAIEAGSEFRGDTRLELVHERFSRLEQILQDRHLRGNVDGIMMDLGVSSPQLDDAQRGFSFRFTGPLDMRMDPSVGVSAAQWLASVTETELREVLWELGEERFGRRIARKIIEGRARSPITTTTELVELVKQAAPGGRSRIHPATRTFQAIRLKVNSELDELRGGLQQAAENLRIGGRLVVLSFHSLEDRIVKRYFRDLARVPDSFAPVETTARFRLPVRKSIIPSSEEIERNPRARSARLRVLERVEC